MPFFETPLKDLLIFEPTVFHDERGYFFESFNKINFEGKGLNAHFVQDNQSFSTYGVIRGLHYQLNPHAQAKLVRAVSGTILDVAVDIRRQSPTYGKWFSIELSSENKKQLYIPAGFAHGFSVLSETAEVFYKCDGGYQKQAEGGIRFDDPELNIDWQLTPSVTIVSEKDKALPYFRTALNNF